MACEQEITVSSTVTVSDHPPVQLEWTTTVESVVRTCKLVPPTAQPVRADLLRQEHTPPELVLVEPLWPDEKKVKYEKEKVSLEYTTVKEGGQGDRKPITKTHVFYDGMPEWMTDRPGSGSLQQLVFWCMYDGKVEDPTEEEGKKGLKRFEGITVRVVAGYKTARAKTATKGDGNNGNENRSSRGTEG